MYDVRVIDFCEEFFQRLDLVVWCSGLFFFMPYLWYDGRDWRVSPFGLPNKDAILMTIIMCINSHFTDILILFKKNGTQNLSIWNPYASDKCRHMKIPSSFWKWLSLWVRKFQARCFTFYRWGSYSRTTGDHYYSRASRSLGSKYYFVVVVLWKIPPGYK